MADFGLHPDLTAKLERAFETLRAAGWRPAVGAGYRSDAAQRAKFKSGVSKVDWGYHCVIDAQGNPASHAADVEDFRYAGKTDPASEARAAAFYKALGKAAEAQGLTWGGRWSRSNPVWAKYGLGWDPQHVQLLPNDQLSTVRAEHERILAALRVSGLGEGGLL